MVKTSNPLRVHFMGIGGSGASAVARLAQAQGFIVTGCDLEESSLTYRIRKQGIPVAIGHGVDHLKDVDILAHTPAVVYQNSENSEYQLAVKKNMAMIWEEFMAKQLQKDKFVVAIAGTHGKGHTSAMVSLILEQAGLDPTCAFGANLINWDKRNYRVGKSQYFVCEADEFKDNFLVYKPNLAIITGIEMDHPEYFKDLSSVLKSFVKFINHLQDPKILVVNKTDPGTKLLLKELKDQKWSGKIVDYSGVKVSAKLRLPGEHVKADAAAASAVALALKINSNDIKKALESFQGLERRFEYRGQAEGAKLFDDYAHHPTAVAANIKAARKMFPKSRIVAVFQPHMHARLQTFFDGFIASLKLADKVIVMDVYSPREPGITKPSGKELALAINESKGLPAGGLATYVGGELINVANFLERNLEKNDVVLLMGAGDIYKVTDLLLKSLK